MREREEGGPGALEVLIEGRKIRQKLFYASTDSLIVLCSLRLFHDSKVPGNSQESEK